MLGQFKRFIFLLLFTLSLSATEKSEQQIGLALAGGGALGFAHIGAIQVLDSLGISVDYIAGTSMGGLVGGLYAMGYSGKEIEKLVLEINWEDIFSDKPSRDLRPYLMRKISSKYQLEFEMESFIPKLPSGVLKGQKISLLLSNLTRPFSNIKSFDELPISFRCVGADLVTGDEVVFKDGSLSKAMRATMSIPTAFDPIKIDDYLVIDGGVINNFPVDVVKDMGADYVIGCNIAPTQYDIEEYDDLFKVLDRTTYIPRFARLNENIKLSDIYIEEILTGFSAGDFDHETIPLIIQRGREAIYKKLDKLVALSAKQKTRFNSDNPHIDTLKFFGNQKLTNGQITTLLNITDPYYDRIKFISSADKLRGKFGIDSIRFRTLANADKNIDLEVHIWENNTAVISEIDITGLEKLDESFIRNNLGFREGDLFNEAKLERHINLLYGLGYFSTIRYSTEFLNHNRITINLEISEISFQKFLAGFRYDDYHKLVGIIGFQSNSLFLNGMFFDSEFQFSGLTRFKLSVLYPSRSLDFPIYPKVYADYKRLPRDVYDTAGLKNMSFEEESWTLGISLGIGFSRFVNIEGSIQYEFPDIALQTSELNDSTQIKINKAILASRFTFDYDTIDYLLMPKSGLQIYGDFEFNYPGLETDNDYKRLYSYFDLYEQISNKSVVRLNLKYLRAWGRNPFYKTLFFIGGPEEFVGFNYFQAAGSLFPIFRAEYHFYISKVFLLKGIVNTTMNYKLVFSDDPISGKNLWGFGLGFKYNSIIGPVEITFANGEKNVFDPGKRETKIYFTFGYLF